MRTLAIAGSVLLALGSLTQREAGAQELQAEYTGMLVHLSLDGSYPQYAVERAPAGTTSFETLEFNQVGCIGRCTYDDYAIQYDDAYTYRIVVRMPDGSDRIFGPVTLAIDASLGRALSTRSLPNPMRARARIAWVVPATLAQHAELPTKVTIHDPTGREVNALFAGALPVGEYDVAWEGQDRSGRALPAGSYFYRVQVGSSVEVGRLVLLK